jgi:hypothetical protein
MIVIGRSDFIVIDFWTLSESLITMFRTVDHDVHSGDHDRAPLAFWVLDFSQ